MRRTISGTEVPMFGDRLCMKEIRGKLLLRTVGPVTFKFILHPKPDQKENEDVLWNVTEQECGAACVKDQKTRRDAIHALDAMIEEKDAKTIRRAVRSAVIVTERFKDIVAWQDEINEMLDIKIGTFMCTGGRIDFAKLAEHFGVKYRPGKEGKAFQMHVCRMSAHPRRYHVAGKFEQWEAEQG